jgi:hypothetical protein
LLINIISFKFGELMFYSVAKHLPISEPVLSGFTEHDDPKRVCVNPSKGKHYAENARFIFLNGVGSQLSGNVEKAAKISKIFDGCPIEVVHVPLTFAKAFYALGGDKPRGADLVVQTITDLYSEIQDKPGPASPKPETKILNGGPRLICIAHSGGAATLKSVLSDIPLSIRENMDVITIGGAHQFSTGDFRHVRNYIAEKDILSILRLVDKTETQKQYDLQTHVVPTMEGEGAVACHQFNSQTYRNVLDQIRYEYEQERSKVRKCS